MNIRTLLLFAALMVLFCTFCALPLTAQTELKNKLNVGISFGRGVANGRFDWRYRNSLVSQEFDRKLNGSSYEISGQINYLLTGNKYLGLEIDLENWSLNDTTFRISKNYKSKNFLLVFRKEIFRKENWSTFALLKIGYLNMKLTDCNKYLIGYSSPYELVTNWQGYAVAGAFGGAFRIAHTQISIFGLAEFASRNWKLKRYSIGTDKFEASEKGSIYNFGLGFDFGIRYHF